MWICLRLFCRRGRCVVAQIADNDDERILAIARIASRRGEYGYALFED